MYKFHKGEESQNGTVSEKSVCDSEHCPAQMLLLRQSQRRGASVTYLDWSRMSSTTNNVCKLI